MKLRAAHLCVCVCERVRVKEAACVYVYMRPLSSSGQEDTKEGNKQYVAFLANQLHFAKQICINLLISSMSYHFDSKYLCSRAHTWGGKLSLLH